MPGIFSTIHFFSKSEYFKVVCEGLPQVAFSGTAVFETLCVFFQTTKLLLDFNSDFNIQTRSFNPKGYKSLILLNLLHISLIIWYNSKGAYHIKMHSNSNNQSNFFRQHIRSMRGFFSTHFNNSILCRIITSCITAHPGTVWLFLHYVESSTCAAPLKYTQLRTLIIGWSKFNLP